MCYIIYNGKEFKTKQDFNAFMKANGMQKPKHKKRAKHTNQCREMGGYVKTLMNSIGACKSLDAYYRNGYRQWGNRCKLVITMKGIKEPFKAYQKAYKRVQATLKHIDEESKRGSSAVFQYMQMLVWNVEDLGEAVSNLYKGIKDSGVLLSPMATEELICGNGRRLGLATLVGRSFVTCNNLNNMVKELQEVCDNH